MIHQDCAESRTRERERDQTHSYWYIPSAPRVNYSLLVMESAGMMKMATGEGFPLRQGAGAGSRLVLVATEACSGGTPDLGFFSGVSVFIGIFGVGNKLGGLRGGHEVGGCAQGVGRAPTLVGASGLFWPISDTPWASSGPKIISVNFQVNWIPLGFPFLRYSKTRKKQKLALGSRLIG